jgi:hypothetical protein
MKKSLLIITLAVIICAGGWVAFSKSTKAPVTKNTNQHHTGSNIKTTSDPTENGNYLVIKELGVRFRLSNQLKNKLSYKLVGNSTDTTSSDAIFESKELVDATGDATCRLLAQSWGGYSNGLNVYLSAAKTNLLSNNDDFSFIGKINNYYWYKSIDKKPSINCTIGKHPDISARAQSITDSLSQALKTLEPIPN